MLGSRALLPFVLLASLCGFAQQPTSPPDLTPDKDGKLSQEQMQQLFKIVADKDIENNKRQRDYTYVIAKCRTTATATATSSPRK